MGGSRLAGALLVAASALGAYAASAGAVAPADPRFDPHTRACDRSNSPRPDTPKFCSPSSQGTTTTAPPVTPTTTPTATTLGDLVTGLPSSSADGGGDSLVAQGLPPAPPPFLPGAPPPVLDAPLRGPGGGGGVPVSMLVVIGAVGVATALLVSHGALGRRLRVSVPHEGDTLRFK